MIHRSEPTLRPSLAMVTIFVAAVLCATGSVSADGTSDCVGCHENISKAFETSIHGRMTAKRQLQPSGPAGPVTLHSLRQVPLPQ